MLEQIWETIFRFMQSLTDYLLPAVFGLAVLLAVLIFRRKLVHLILFIIKKITGRFRAASAIADSFERPAVFFLTALAVYFGIGVFVYAAGLRMEAAGFLLFLTKLLKICAICAVTWGLMNAAPPIVEAIQGGEKDVDKTLVVFFSKIVRVVLIIIAAVIVIAEIGYNISGLITGLGIGGLTVALAAKDSASNLFGGLVIIGDKPFAVDDWIETPDLEGVVTDITLRSTRIRTFKDAEVIVPNSTLSNSQIINWSRMKKRRVSFHLGLTYNTPKEKLHQAVDGIRSLLQNHPDVDPDVIVVTFDEFGAYSLDLQIYYFATKTSWGDYMKVKEDVNFQILSYLESIGAEIAFPTQTLICEGETKFISQDSNFQ